MSTDDTVYLKHILEAIEKIERYTIAVKLNEFLADTLIQDGTVRQIEIIGEAAKKILDKIKNKNSEIPWKKIVGMRDKLIHGYFGVDLDAVWKTIKEDIPTLKINVNALLKQKG